MSYILINNKNTSSGKEPTLVKTMLLPGQARVIAVASLPTNPSRDVLLSCHKIWSISGFIVIVNYVVTSRQLQE